MIPPPLGSPCWRQAGMDANVSQASSHIFHRQFALPEQLIPWVKHQEPSSIGIQGWKCSTIWKTNQLTTEDFEATTLKSRDHNDRVRMIHIIHTIHIPHIKLLSSSHFYPEPIRRQPNSRRPKIGSDPIYYLYMYLIGVYAMCTMIMCKYLDTIVHVFVCLTYWHRFYEFHM